MFDAMRLTPPDFNLADKEKVVVEDEQRANRKGGKVFTSRFGFTSPYDGMGSLGNSAVSMHETK